MTALFDSHCHVDEEKFDQDRDAVLQRMAENGVTRMVSVKNQDSISKLLDMIPDFVDKFMKKVEEKRDPEKAAAREAAKEEAAKDLKEKLNLEEE